MYKMLLLIIVQSFFQCLYAQAPVTINKHFSIGTYGRVGIARSNNFQYPRSLNLNGMGSVGGRMEEGDYVELATAFHYTPITAKNDSTAITVQARLALYTTNGQIIGNVNSHSYGGLTAALPELFAEAREILGTNWTVWIGARFNRGDDIHIIDQFYFDDHSSQGFGIAYKMTHFSVMFPGAVDTSSTLPPYFYLTIVNGSPVLALRNRAVYILEQVLPLKKGYVKLMGEFQRLGNATSEDTTSVYNYPSDYGFVLGAKLRQEMSTKIEGSYFDVSLRYGSGIANGGDGGGSKTFLTYGAPNLETQQFRNAGSLAFTSSILWNINRSYSLNPYLYFTKSRGASDSLNKAPDYYGNLVFNRKTDFAIGARGTWYIKNWFHFLHEINFASRKDGSQAPAQMFKISVAPTIVPTAERSVWARPHLRLVYSLARYNKFASQNLYSAYLAQSGNKTWGYYFGVKAEWWLW